MSQNTNQGEPGALNPLRLTVEHAARILSASGGRSISVDTLRQDVAAGAPTNPDGTLNLVHYAAWLLRAMSRSQREAER